MILHPIVVAWAVKNRCRSIEEAKQRQLKGMIDPSMRRSMTRKYNRFIKEEKERYATVKIVKVKGGWLLRYLNEKDGTGPFATEAEAAEWFLGEGR